MINRREFVAILAASSVAPHSHLSLPMTLAPTDPSASSTTPLLEAKDAPEARAGFPISDYTPFGYLDNPWHSWNMHRSGVFRSVPGIGFGLYYPAGPGGYFDYHDNGVYSAELALAFRIGDSNFRAPGDFAPGQLISPHHSKNIMSYQFEAEGVRVISSFVQVSEDVLAARVELSEQSGRDQTVRVLASHTYRLGGSDWWGRDGLAGDFDRSSDTLWIRSFAAGTVFAIAASQQSVQHFMTNSDPDRASWLEQDSRLTEKLSYYPEPLYGGLRYEVELRSRAQKEIVVVMARGANKAMALERAKASLLKTVSVLDAKRGEDAAFWNSAPRLSGDWPKHWQHGWVYDFETLRMMVRRPIGLYRHPWDAMQIQAPRNVLAETSIDMWALSYADPETAKAVFLGQFLDAPEANVPCMREDGVMNMVAADGSECGTSISWCFPYFCAASIFDRTHDTVWLRKLYPRLGALLRWTLMNRVDSGGFIFGKCSWETGMDTSKRFQIQQPTGGELVEFLRLVELQAAAAHGAATLARFARILGDSKDLARWEDLQRTYTAKTQELWKDDWFHDYDNRAKKLTADATRDPSQASPAFCGIASDDQKKRMLPTLHQMKERLATPAAERTPSWDSPLEWSSFVLPYLEAAWASTDRELASETVAMIADRIYTSMDRRSAGDPTGVYKGLGWPGVSCEVWGANGAFGGEGYGWGAVLPAHIIRNVVGFRETAYAGRVLLCPSFAPALTGNGKRYSITGLSYGRQKLDLEFGFVDDRRIQVESRWSGPLRVKAVRRADGSALEVELRGLSWRFEAENHGWYEVELSGTATADRSQGAHI